MDGVTLSCLGHSTTLIKLRGTMILTDPALLERVGIRLFKNIVIGPKRLAPSALSISELPPLDLILISHAHRDHMDKGTLRRLPKGVPVVVPAGGAGIAAGCGFKDVRELAWGKSIEAGGALITAVQVEHSGRRDPWEREGDRACNGYLISRSGSSVFFAGDSADTRFSPGLAPSGVDVAVMGIGGYDPFIWSHATPEQVWKMSRELGARYLFPIHWGTFKLSEERIDEPMRRLLAAAAGEEWRVAVRLIGQTFVLPKENRYERS